MKKLPWFAFYSGDWLKDPALRSVSRAARGLWIDCLALMWESPEKGFLVLKSGVNATVNPTLNQLARMTAGDPSETQQLIAELEHAGVLSRDSRQVIYSRRMVRDQEVRTRASESGKRGGNPLLTGRSANRSQDDRNAGSATNEGDGQQGTVDASLNQTLKGSLNQSSVSVSVSQQEKDSIEKKSGALFETEGDPPSAQEQAKPKRTRSSEVYKPDFEAAWAIYLKTGNPGGKVSGQAAWQKALRYIAKRPTENTVEWLTERVRAYSASPKGQGDFSPHFSTWLNEGRFDGSEREWARGQDRSNGRRTAGAAGGDDRFHYAPGNEEPEVVYADVDPGAN